VLLLVASIAGVVVPAGLTMTSGAATAAPTLDHFECYTASATTTKAVRVSFKATPHTALLKNRFALAGFTAGVGKLQMQCSPTQQTVRPAGVTSPITNANARLVCWAIAPTTLTLPASLTVGEPVRHRSAEADRGAVVVPAVVEKRNRPFGLPVVRARQQTLIRTCAIRRSIPPELPRSSCPCPVALKDQFGTATTRAAPRTSCAFRPSGVRAPSGVGRRW